MAKKRRKANNFTKFKNFFDSESEFEISHSRKKQTTHKPHVYISPRGENQESYVNYLLDDSTSIVIGTGPSGTGKTLLATQAAVKGFIDGRYTKIVVTRPNEDVDNKGIGHLPGTLEEKMNPYLMPIIDILSETYTQREIENFILEKKIEIVPVAFIRGRSFHNSFIICDEAQGTTTNSLKAILTRIGDNSKMAITGDINQADRLGSNGLDDLLKRLTKTPVKGIEVIKFGRDDIQRNPIIGKILKLYGEE